MTKKQTAVEWLIESLNEIDWCEPKYFLLELKALEMERNQKEAYWSEMLDVYNESLKENYLILKRENYERKNENN